MEKIMTWDNVHNFAYINDAVCEKPIRGIMLTFFGLNSTTRYTEDTEEGILFGGHGILVVVPYNSPWSWMNRQAVDYTDEIIDVLFDHFALPAALPIISTGSSMGGLAAITYTAQSKRTPKACLANCPVCDLPYHFTERPDLPRTLYNSFWNYEGTLEDAMKTASPVHLVHTMPDAEYMVFHGDADKSVNKERHSDRFVAAMKERGHRVTYIEIPGQGHAALPPAEKEIFNAAVIRTACGA